MTIHPRFAVSLRLDYCRAPACRELTRRLYVETESGGAFRACCTEHAERAAHERERCARICNRPMRLMAPWEGKEEPHAPETD